MRKWLVLGAVLACAACGGSGSAKVTATITGGTKAERALAREVLQKLEPSPVTSVVFRGLQHDSLHHWPGRRVDVVGSGEGQDAVWQEQVFGYSYVLLARERHIPVGFLTTDEGAGLLQNELRGAPTRTTDNGILDAYESKLRSAAKAAGVPIAFRELRSGGPVALMATVTAAHPAAFLKDHAKLFWNLWRQAPRQLLGFELTVQDGTSEPALQEDWALNGGGGFIRQDLAGCTYFWDHPTMNPEPRPPCPA